MVEAWCISLLSRHLGLAVRLIIMFWQLVLCTVEYLSLLHLFFYIFINTLRTLKTQKSKFIIFTNFYCLNIIEI